MSTVHRDVSFDTSVTAEITGKAPEVRSPHDLNQRLRGRRRRGNQRNEAICFGLSLQRIFGFTLALLVLHELFSFSVINRWSHDNDESVTLMLIHGSKGRRQELGIAAGIHNLADWGYKVRPMQVAFHFDSIQGSYLSPPRSMLLDFHPYPSEREISISKDEHDRQQGILSSRHYNSSDHKKHDIYKDFPECQPIDDWQTKSFPTCNSMHELDMTDMVGFKYEHGFYRKVYYKDHGYFRDVWVARDYNDERNVLKTLRYDSHDFDEANFDRHQKDAVAMEKLTSSPSIIDIYCFCGQSSLHPYGKQGTINSVLWKDKDKRLEYLQRLKIGVQVAEAISQVHNINSKKPGAIVHTDIMTNQFIQMDDGRFKLNDFNRAVFVYWNTTSNDGYCPFKYPDGNAWIFRSPEEYAYTFQTEKVDIYSMGNILYTLLEYKYPFHEDLDDKTGSTKEDEIKRLSEKVKNGARPQLREEVMNSTDLAAKSLIKAMHMCWEQDWRQRSSADDVKAFLIDAVSEIQRGMKAGK